MLATPGHGVLIDFADPAAPVATNVPLDLVAAGLTILVTDTGVRHALADGDGGYAQRRAEAEAGMPSRVRHVRTENDRVRATVAAVEAGDWAGVGALLTASHVSLRDDYEVSVRELDLTVEAALEAGALGARMTGGGFGGCAISLVHEGRAGVVRDDIDAAYAAAGLPQPVHHQVVPAEGARLLTELGAREAQEPASHDEPAGSAGCPRRCRGSWSRAPTSRASSSSA
ncbi:hypothetical protein [Nocardioides convexus]|uniref:hypothetical protein n=1 Tax=Nocardioides convexus TaxID=2712224 RepID=UPI002418A593|nr:hypothetical protein [Nocardioides convexus]